MPYLRTSRGASGRKPSGPLTLNRASPQAHGLAACWPLGMNGQELVAGRTGVLTSSVTVGSDSRIGQATKYDAALASYVNTGTPSLYNFGANDYTMSLWIVPYVLSSSLRQQVWSKDGDAAIGRQFTTEINNTIDVGTTSSVSHVLFTSDSTIFGYTTPNVLTAFMPALLTYGIRASAMFIAVNGIEQSLTPLSGSSAFGAMQTTTTQAHIGRRVYTGFEEGFTGLLSDARVYNRALSTADIWALYNPPTRWDLYQTISGRLFFDMGAAAAAARIRKQYIVRQSVNRSATF